MTQWGLDSLFNPSKRHMDEEKRRLQATREEVGDNSGGERIDLVSGKVVIRRKPKDEQPEAEESAEPPESGEDVPAAKADSDSESSSDSDSNGGDDAAR